MLDKCLGPASRAVGRTASSRNSFNFGYSCHGAHTDACPELLQYCSVVQILKLPWARRFDKVKVNGQSQLAAAPGVLRCTNASRGASRGPNASRAPSSSTSWTDLRRSRSVDRRTPRRRLRWSGRRRARRLLARAHARGRERSRRALSEVVALGLRASHCSRGMAGEPLGRPRVPVARLSRLPGPGRRVARTPRDPRGRRARGCVRAGAGGELLGMCRSPALCRFRVPTMCNPGRAPPEARRCVGVGFCAVSVAVYVFRARALPRNPCILQLDN